MSTAPERASPPSSALHTCSAPSRDQPWNWIDSTCSLLRCNSKLNYIKSSFAYLFGSRSTYDMFTNSDFLLLLMPFCQHLYQLHYSPNSKYNGLRGMTSTKYYEGVSKKIPAIFPRSWQRTIPLVLLTNTFKSGFPYLIANLLVRVHVIASIRFVLDESFVRLVHIEKIDILVPTGPEKVLLVERLLNRMLFLECKDFTLM